MAKCKAIIGQIWQDDCYYLDPATSRCMRKYVLILAADKATDDYVTVVFTSKPNGLPESPACYVNYPRAGFFLGIPGGVLSQPTWIDFSSIETLDGYDLDVQVSQKRKTLVSQSISNNDLCQILRCIQQYQEDISRRQWKLLGDTIQQLNCP